MTVSAELRRRLESMPKVELHVHLEGTTVDENEKATYRKEWHEWKDSTCVSPEN